MSLDHLLDHPPRQWARLTYALAVAVVVVLVMGTGRPRPGLHGSGLVVGVGLVLLLVATLGYLGLRWLASRYAVLALVLMSAIGLAVHAFVPKSPGIGFAYAAVWVATARERLWHAGGLCALGLAGTLWVSVAHHATARSLAWVVCAYLGSLALALVLRSSRSVRRREREAREQTAVAQARTAVLDERGRIAREIHDILAHTLSAQSVQLEGARLLLSQGADADLVRERVEQAQRLTREGMEETRRAVHALRGDALPAPELLGQLARESDVPFVVDGERRDLAPEVGLAVLRTGQEALTNVRKHATGARASMVLRYGDGYCELEVTDTGDGAGQGPMATAGTGYGLAGIRERAELLGGSLDAGRADGGFLVRLRIPT
ncbi:MAG: sensor histidine kinase [Streptosporangiaceae bacterium]